MRFLGLPITCLLLCSTAIPLVAAAQGFDARFSVHAYGATVGDTLWRLRPNDKNEVTLRVTSRTTGVAALVRNVIEYQETTLQQLDKGYRPTKYHYQRRGDRRERDVTINFDWRSGQALGTSSGTSWKLPINANAWDESSYILALIADLRAGKRQMSYPVIGDFKRKNFAFVVEKEEVVDTELGKFDTLKVKRIRTDGRSTIYWNAAKLDYMPVKISHHERDGWSLELRIESLHIQRANGTSFEAGSPMTPAPAK